MLARLEQHRAPATQEKLGRARHLLIVLPKADKLAALGRVPFIGTLESALERRKKKLSELAKSPFSSDADDGALIAWAMDDPKRSTFERQSTMRKALQLLLAENPREIAVAVFGDAK